MKKFFRDILQGGAVGLLFQGTFVPLTSGTNAGGETLAGPLSQFLTSNGSLPGLFQSVFTLALSAGAILAVLRLSYAGWLYMGAADMWGSKQKAKDVIFDAVLGLLLLIGIWIVLDQINPCLLDLNVLQTIQGNSSQQCSGS